MRGVRFDSRVVDNLRETDALFWRCPLPRHPAGERQNVHLDSMLVHPLDAFVEVEIQRKRIGWRGPSHFDLSLRVALGSPVRMHVDRKGTNRRRVRGTRLPGGPLLRERVADAHADRRSGSDTQLEKSTAVQPL